MSRKPLTILDVTRDPNLFGPWFKNPNDWWPWFTFLKSLFNIPLEQDEYEFFSECTGRTTAPTKITEGYLICGRRAGKSFMLAMIAVFLACFRDYRPYLTPGERATVIIVAADRRQARVIFRYMSAFLNEVPLLANLIENQTAERFNLRGQVTIEIHTASYRSIRGYTISAALLDEVAFWRSDEHSQNPDSEILTAIRPGMKTIPDSVMFCASSPYGRQGVLWEAYKKHFNKNNDRILVWKAPTWQMNRTITKDDLQIEFEEDFARANAEYGAEFRSDVETFISEEALEICIPRGIYERPFNSQYEYSAFVDPSGGSKDSMTIAVAHHEGEVDRPVLDVVREFKPPFSPESVVREMSELLKSYGLYEVHGDRYGGEWPRERFQEHGVVYTPAERVKSDIYRELLPLINSGKCLLLDNDRMIAQFLNLERRSIRGGRDTIDHPSHAHDDLANAVAGAIDLCNLSGSLEVW